VNAKRILVVDDNVPAARALAVVLELWGHQAFIAHDGRAALEQVRRVHPHVVLLDIGLPGMDGFEVAAALRREPGQGPMRVISMSGVSREGDVLRALESGVDQHLSKPVGMRFLRSLFGPRS
jgi:CheY-like chemotaxis protein